MTALEIGELVADVLREVEGSTALRDAQGIRHCVRAVIETGGHQFRRRQVELIVAPAHVVGSVQSSAIADRHQHVLETGAALPVIVDVAGCYDGQVQAVGQSGERLRPCSVTADRVVLELDEDPSGSERFGELACEGLALGHAGVEVSEKGALPAARQKDQPAGAA